VLLCLEKRSLENGVNDVGKTELTEVGETEVGETEVGETELTELTEGNSGHRP
jgi:hypothetical protein